MLLSVPLVAERGLFCVEKGGGTGSSVNHRVFLAVGRVAIETSTAKGNVRRLLLGALDAPVSHRRALLATAEISIRLCFALSIEGATTDTQVVLADDLLTSAVGRVHGLISGLQRRFIRVSVQRGQANSV